MGGHATWQPSAGTSLSTGAGPLTLTVSGRWPATRLLAKARAAAKARTDAYQVVKAARALQREETCCFWAPAAGDLKGQDDEPATRRAQQLGVRALLGFARGTKGCASNTAAVAARRSIGVELGNQSDVDCQLRSAPKRESIGNDLDSPVVEAINVDIEMLASWPLAGLLLTSCWPLAGVFSCWLLAGLLLASCWPLAALLLASCWPLAGFLLASCWLASS